MECILCKIVAGEIPCYKVYEDAKFLAFLDITPVNPGHVILIPKQHTENLLDTADEILNEFLPLAKKIAKVVMAVTKADGFNLNQNNFSAAGQVIGHLHFHIVPRFSDDGLELWRGKEYGEGEAEILAEKIRTYND